MLEALTELIATLVHLALVLLAAPIVAGLSGWLDARLAGRAGPPLTAPFRDLLRLSRKAPAVPESASAVLTLAPVITLAATVGAAALVPSITLGMILAPLGDGLVVASLLSLARMAVCLGALDTGAAASGRAAEQSCAVAMVSEPALLMTVFGLALMGGGFNLDQVIGQQSDGMLLPAAASALALTALLALALADMTGVTADLYTDLSGIDLAIAQAALWLRLVVWIDLIGALFLPIGMAGPRAGLGGWGIGLLAWLAKLLAGTLCLAVVKAMIGNPARHALANLVAIGALLAILSTVIILSSAGPA